MPTVELHQVDAFTNEMFTGNPAGVVTNAEGLSEEIMRKIAREMNLSETAFVLDPSTEEADLRLRYFTPTSEIKFCGHATVAALAQLAQMERFGLGGDAEAQVRVETNAGILPMSVAGKLGKNAVTFTAPEVQMESYYAQDAHFADLAGVPADLIHPRGTILKDVNLNYLYIPTSSLEALETQRFDFDRMRRAFHNEGTVVFCFFSDQTKNPLSNLHARGLAPLVGVEEDPFTGSMQSGLMHAAKMNRMLEQTVSTVATEQGHEIGRAGSAVIHHNTATNRVTVTAQAAKVFSTELKLAQES